MFNRLSETLTDIPDEINRPHFDLNHRFYQINQKKRAIPQNQWGGHQAVLKRPRDDPDGSKKGMTEGQKRIIERFQMKVCTTLPATQVGRDP